MTVAAPADSAAPAGRLLAHPLFHAGRWLLADLASTLLFVGLYAITKNLFVATGVAIAVGVGQIAVAKLRGRPVEAMQWLGVALVVAFGGASLLTHDPRFVMLKPSLIYLAVGVVMLKPGWMLRYMPPIAAPWSGDVTTVFGYVWAGLMIATAVINLVVATTLGTAAWAAFIAVVPLASKLVLFAIQYATTRLIVRRRIHAANGAAFTPG